MNGNCRIQGPILTTLFAFVAMAYADTEIDNE